MEHDHLTEKQNRVLVILAGGQSSRMGRDKTFLPYKDTTFLGYLLRKAESCFSNIWISAGSKEHAEKIRKYLQQESGEDRARGPATGIVTDLYERIGPMGGILSVFETIESACFVLLAVDIPDADMEVLAVLSELAGQHGEAALMLQLSDAGHAEACAAVYNRKAYRLIRAAYERGEYSLRKALGEDQVRLVGVKELRTLLPELRAEDLREAFRNINCPQEYMRSSEK